MTGPTLQEALAARGYGSRPCGFIDGHAISFSDAKREVFDIESDDFIGHFTAIEAWEWLEETVIAEAEAAP